MAVRELIRRLELPKEERPELKPVLRALLTEGEIRLDGRNLAAWRGLEREIRI